MNRIKRFFAPLAIWFWQAEANYWETLIDAPHLDYGTRLDALDALHRALDRVSWWKA